MPTRRMIEPGFWQSESMGRLTIRQRLMFIGIFSNADDQGRLRASAPIIRSIVLPFDDVALAEVEADILAIEREKCIKLYTVNDARYAQVLNWWTYQTPQWAYPSLIPKPDGWSDRLRFRHGGEVIAENWQRGKAPEDNTDQDSISKDSIVKGKATGKPLPKGSGKDLPKDSADKPRSKPEKDTCPQEWMTALYRVTQTDPSLASGGLRKRISDTGKALIKAGAKLSDVDRFGAWWVGDKWRAEHTPVPSPEQVRDNWQKMNTPGAEMVKKLEGKRDARLPEYTQADYELAALINADRGA